MTAVEPPHSPSANHQRHEHQYYRWANPIAALALLVACSAAAFAWWQGRLISESNEIARQNNVISQRAFVSAALMQMWVSFKPDRTPNALNFMLGLTNNGNTATKHLTFYVKCDPAAQDLQEPWSIFYQGLEKIEQTPMFIAPHSTQTVGCSFPFEQIRQMAEGSLFGFLMLDIVYFDRLDPTIRHRTQFANKLTQINIPPTNAVAALLTPCGQHNCA